MGQHPCELGGDDQELGDPRKLHVYVEKRGGGIHRTDQDHLEEGL